ncbi:MAG: hypothetical protein JWM73_2948 [Solirubrobacterales bacterium]|nr:hypothetical protein [Solirubrobacterales bacterium]
MADVSNRSAGTYPVLPPLVTRLCLSLLAVMVVSPTAVCAAAPGLNLGFYDGALSTANRGAWLQDADGVGAQVLRIDIGWPAGREPVDATDPADPAYGFATADASIRAIADAGMTPDVSFTGAPTWAEGAGRPGSAPVGSWKPAAPALHDYAIALGRRYSGTYPDPAHPGETLPKVTYFQVWNEPNLSKYLSPQWVRDRNGIKAYAPGHYRAMLNAFAAGLRSVRPDAKVVTAGTAPFGDNTGGNRIRPLQFWRTMLAKPTEFDIAAHHPYGVAVPTRHALNADDMTVPDLGKLRRLLTAKGHAEPIWVTEVSYDSSPPDPDGVPIAQHARWLTQTLYLLWKAKVTTVLWYLIRDNPPVPSYPESNQAGVYYLDGTPKPAATAFRFPFLVVPDGRRQLAWARAPERGRLVLERRSGGRWTPVASKQVAARQIVEFHLRGATVATFRVRIGTDVSLTFAAPQFGH